MRRERLILMPCPRLLSMVCPNAAFFKCWMMVVCAVVGVQCLCGTYLEFAESSGICQRPRKMLSYGQSNQNVPNDGASGRLKDYHMSYWPCVRMSSQSMLAETMLIKFHWFAGHELCREAWIRFLGVGNDRVTRCKRNHQGVDMRTVSGPGCAWVALMCWTLLNHIESCFANDDRHETWIMFCKWW